MSFRFDPNNKDHTDFAHAVALMLHLVHSGQVDPGQIVNGVAGPVAAEPLPQNPEAWRARDKAYQGATIEEQERMMREQYPHPPQQPQQPGGPRWDPNHEGNLYPGLMDSSPPKMPVEQSPQHRPSLDWSTQLPENLL